jgi:hypothetical protein
MTLFISFSNRMSAELRLRRRSRTGTSKSPEIRRFIEYRHNEAEVCKQVPLENYSYICRNQLKMLYSQLSPTAPAGTRPSAGRDDSLALREVLSSLEARGLIGDLHSTSCPYLQATLYKRRSENRAGGTERKSRGPFFSSLLELKFAIVADYRTRS